ncbi:MAG: M23 family metallopeptidase [Anaerolineaceae bacterium]|nr:M23 family metallopeptidase [Anaerolineaceae bacterium]
MHEKIESTRTPDLPPADDSDDNGGNQKLIKLWERLLHLGLGETTLRISTVVLTLGLFIIVIWVMGNFYVVNPSTGMIGLNAEAGMNATPTEEVVAPAFSLPDQLFAGGGISKQAALHTILPSRGRTEMEIYTVQLGDTLFSIAERFGLKPETILWGNRYTLGDDPHTIFQGQQLNILPMDGVLHKWSAGEGLNSVANFYEVTPEDIINYAPNGLNMATIGDYIDPNIREGAFLIIPGGKGVFTDWRTPRISRDEPATANYVGAGACTGSYEGVTGTLNFSWPTTERYLSGYEYSPATNHYGIDIAGKLGNAIFAADSGVVVYAGWNDWGFGEMVVIDHGFGWQTLYAHLSVINVGCGQEVYRGDIIAQMGSTGNSSGTHLHFEMRSDDYGRVNPWDFLQ